MSYRQNGLALLFMWALGLSMLIVPGALMASTDQVSSPELPVETKEQLEDWYQTLSQPGFSARIDPVLADWSSTGVLDKAVVTDLSGNPNALVFMAPWADEDAIRDIVRVKWSVDLKVMKTMMVSISSQYALEELSKVSGVGYIEADFYLHDVGDDLVKTIDTANPTPGVGPDMYEIREVVKADEGVAAGYNGSGVVVGHIDTGMDYGNPDLQHTYDWDFAPYDPSGFGLTPTFYHVNSTPVENVTAWLDNPYNLLSYEEGGKYYVNVSGWDPITNMNGIARYLIGDGSYDEPYYERVGFVWLYAYFWEIDGVDTMLEHIWNDIELPDPSILVGNYSLGWVQQHRSSPYARLFAPALVWNCSTTHKWQLAINWADTMGWNKFWTGGIYYESYNFTDVSNQTEIINEFDWSFVDDIEAGHVYNETNPIVAYDYSGDGLDDFSLGALGWVYDDAGWFADEKLFKGFRSDGDAIGLYYDHQTHGTATAAHVAGAGIVEYFHSDSDQDFTNDSFYLKGIAPAATIQSARFITGGSYFGANLWVCGFSYNETSDSFYWKGDTQSHIVTNSWGWVTTPNSELNYLALTWTILSTPEFFEYETEKYPGVLQVCSAGNNGAGFMTIGPPGAAAGVLTVGASTTSHWLEYLYGPTQPHEGLASFTSKGPAFTGYVKPDVLAPGLAGYSVRPIYSQLMAEAWTGPYAGPISDLAYTLFSGTSQSAPVAAGVAALVWQAYASGEHIGKSMYVKSIIQNTADDLGYDPATQGFGRINADEACDLANDTAGIMFYGSDSWDIHAAILQEAWEYWGIPYWIGTDVDNTAIPYPTGVIDSSLFFGHIYHGQSVTVAGDVWHGGTGQVNYTALDGWGLYAYEYRPAEIYQFTDTTFWYECSITGQMAYGFYNLRDAIGAGDYDAAVATYDYVTIGVSFDAADIADYGAPWMFLYDWEDKDSDGSPGLYNITTGEGDELHRLTSASDPSNVNMMAWANGTHVLSDALLGNLTIVIHDPAHDIYPGFSGNEFTITVAFWGKHDITDAFALSENAGDHSVDITFTADPNMPFGINQGYLELDIPEAGIVKLPMSVMIVADLTEDAGEVHEITNGTLSAVAPYSAPMYGCMEGPPKDYDFRSFVVHNPHETAMYLGVRVEWEHGGNNMQVAVINPVGSTLASGSAKTAKTTAVLASLPADPVGNYYIMVHALALNGTEIMPVPYRLEVIWYEELTTKYPLLSYTSNDQPEATEFEDKDTLIGDHVVLNVSYPRFNLPNMPEYEVVETTVEVLSGIYVQRHNELVIPDSDYNPFTDDPIDLDQFAWEIVDGISAGDTVKLELWFTNTDSDLFVYWADTDNSTWTYTNNLIGSAMVTTAKPETHEFVASRSGSLAFGIFDYDLEEGWYTLTVETVAGIDKTAVGPEVTIDTYALLKNGTFMVKVTALTATDIVLETTYTEVTINNFFSPKMGAVSVTGDDTEKTISWSVTDLNIGDDHYFEVYLSSDGGITYELLAANITETTYDWDSSGFLKRNDYTIKIVAFDNDPIVNPVAGPDNYWPGLSDSAESAVFSAGDVISDPSIVITSDEDFVTQGWPGSGTPDDPYVIEGLNITSTEVCINISNTSVYFEIRNCFISSFGQSSNDGIVLSNVSYGVISYTIVELHRYGIYVINSSGIILMDNTIVNNNVGIVLDSSDSCILTRNLVTDNSEYGIRLHSGSSGNTFYANLIGYNSMSNALDDGISNFWDNGVSLGNCWSDYTAPGIYNIPGTAESVDNYPLGWGELDFIPPTIDSPQDMQYESGSVGHSITWNPSDSYPDRYEVHRNGSLISHGDWDGSEISVNVDGLGIGTYNYTIVVYNALEKWVSDTVFVTVVDTISPMINHPQDIQYEEGTTGNSITWYPSDNNPSRYEVYRNGSLIISLGWNGSEISVSVDGLGVGTHNYTVVVYDTSENWNSDTVFVTVMSDVTPPVIDSPQDMQYEVGTTGNSITWHPSDNNPSRYEVYRNGSLIISLGWNGSEISVIVDGLFVGVYNYTIAVYDTSENSASDTVFVTVTAPSTTLTDTDTTTSTPTEPDTGFPLLEIVVLAGVTGVAVVVIIAGVFRFRKKP